MCGISGYIGNKTITPDRIDKCLKAMKHRGPDALGSYSHQFRSEQNVYMLHTRLSIIDLDKRSNQPFRINSKILIFNGELYNYIELKKELTSIGCNFKTGSDTEVLMQVILWYGWKGLDKCEGMWALALYDENDGSLMLSRDRFGEKPLYIFKDSKGLYFGSEIKFISVLRETSPSVNYQHIYTYLINGYKSLYKQKSTFYQDFEQVSSSSALFIQKDQQKTVRYWNPKFEQNDVMTYEHAVEESRKRLIDSVKLRLRSDVPIAFCMSGGIDSNSLICIAKKIFNYNVHGFTIENKDIRYDEKELVEHVVNKLSIKHNTIPVKTNNFLQNLRTIIINHDAPTYTISYYAHWLLAESIAEQGYKISVSGTGADELFSGYYDHHNAYLYEIYNNHPELFDSSLKAWRKYIFPIVRNPLLQNPKMYIDQQSFRGHIYFRAKEFSTFLTKPFHMSFHEENYCPSLMRNRMLNELFHEAVPQILHEDDLNSMYFSIENRSPFLDRNLFEHCISVPTRFLIQNGMAKSILRQAMKGIVPDRIIDERRKIGFNAPLFSFLNLKNSDIYNYLLDNSTIFNIVHKNKIESLLNKDQLLNSESKFLFNFINSKIFLEIFE